MNRIRKLSAQKYRFETKTIIINSRILEHDILRQKS